MNAPAAGAHRRHRRPWYAASMPRSISRALVLRWIALAALTAGLFATACARRPADKKDGESRPERIAQLAASLHQGDPWPAIRAKRLGSLLARSMDASGVDAWVIFCRENGNDPLAMHVGCENAGRLAGVTLFRTKSGIEEYVVASGTEVPLFRETLPQARVSAAANDAAVFDGVAAQLRQASPRVIAVNKSMLAAGDGLTATEQDELRRALGPELSARIGSSEGVVARWLAIKLPEEIEIMRRAAALTELLEYEALDAIVPGKTTNGDIAEAMRRRVAELGFRNAWLDNPGVQSGLDRGRGSDPTRVVRPGDVVDIDFGIEVYDTWCTDLQRFAYVLGPDEEQAPSAIQYAWDSASQGSRRMLARMRPGATGRDIDKVQGDWMRERGSLGHPFRTGHPVGYWAHDLGPSLSGYRPEAPAGDGGLKLEAGMVFAFDGDYVWKATDGSEAGTRSITLEEMAVITSDGAEYLSPVQEKLVLIAAPAR